MYATIQGGQTQLEASTAHGLRSGAVTRTAVAALDLLLDTVQAEAGVWAPDAAARAVEQSRGDGARAVTLLRVWAATLPAVEAAVVGDEDVRILRRLTPAYVSASGGQWFGASQDYAGRLLEWADPTGRADSPAFDDQDRAVARSPEAGRTARAPGNGSTHAAAAAAAAADPRSPDHDHDPAPTAPDVPPRRSEVPRPAYPPPGFHAPALDGDGPDPTREPVRAPAGRLGRLAVLARGETGALVALAAGTMGRRREAILTEIAAGVAEVSIAHPRTGGRVPVVEVPIVEADAVVDGMLDGRLTLFVGHGVSIGRVERRAAAIAVLDAASVEDEATGTSSKWRVDEAAIAGLVDGLATAGFVDHLKLPHYASFNAFLERLR